MEPGLLATAREFISGYWPHVSGGAVAVAATVGTAIFAYIRRPKSSPTDAGPYFTDAALLSPPLTRPAYSDRTAYVLAEMSDLAYYQFAGQRGFVDDFLKTPVYRIVISSDIVPRVPLGAVMMGLVLLVQGISWLTRFAPPVSAAFEKLGEFLDKLNGYRHFGDMRYLSDVAEGSTPCACCRIRLPSTGSSGCGSVWRRGSSCRSRATA